MSKKKLLFMPKLRFFNSKNNIIGKKKKLHVLQSIYGKTKGGLFCLFFSSQESFHLFIIGVYITVDTTSSLMMEQSQVKKEPIYLLDKIDQFWKSNPSFHQNQQLVKYMHYYLYKLQMYFFSIVIILLIENSFFLLSLLYQLIIIT